MIPVITTPRLYNQDREAAKDTIIIHRSSQKWDLIIDWQAQEILMEIPMRMGFMIAATYKILRLWMSFERLTLMLKREDSYLMFQILQLSFSQLSKIKLRILKQMKINFTHLICRARTNLQTKNNILKCRLLIKMRHLRVNNSKSNTKLEKVE